MQGLLLGTLGTSGRRRELAGLSGGANLFPPAKAADTEPPVTSVSPHVARRRKRSLSSSSEPSSRCGSGRPGAAAGTRAGADGSSSPGSPCACWVRPVPCLSPACPHVPRGPGPLLWGRHCSEEILSRLIRGAPWGAGGPALPARGRGAFPVPRPLPGPSPRNASRAVVPRGDTRRSGPSDREGASSLQAAGPPPVLEQ